MARSLRAQCFPETAAPQFTDPLEGVPKGASRTEALLTSAEAFGIASATAAQRAACRILDGVPLLELRSHPDVVALVGGPGAVSRLPSERGEQPLEVCFLAAIRAAKSITACAAAIRMARSVDVSSLGAGETVRVPITSLTLDKAAETFQLLSATISASPKLRTILLDEPKASSLVIRHSTGRPVEIAVAAGKKAGGSLVGVWLAGVIFDEAPRMNGATDAVVNLDHARAAVLGRLLPGAQALYIGSPWAPHGPVYDMVEQGWAQPSSSRVVLRGTGPMLNPSWWTPERCDQLRSSNPTSYHTDVLGQFAEPDGGLIGPDALKRNTRKYPRDLPFELHGVYTGSLDPSEGTDHGNPWTLVIVKREQRNAPASRPDGSPLLGLDGNRVMRPRWHFVVALAKEWRGKRPSEVLEEAAKVLRGYGLTRAITDQYAGSANADLAKRYGLELEIIPWTGPRKVQAYTNLATLCESDAIELHPDPQFQRDLASVRKRTTQQAVAIDLPRMGDGRHCDYAPALAAAVEQSGIDRAWSAKTINFRGL